MAIEMHQGGVDAGVQAQGQPFKFSRYRSVRQAASKQQRQIQQQDAVNASSATSVPLPTAAAAAATTTTTTEASRTPSTIARSMSRYRRVKPAPVPPSPMQPPLPKQIPGVAVQRDGNIGSHHLSSRQQAQAGALGGSKDKAAGRADGQDDARNQRAKDYEEALIEKHRQEAMDRLTGGQSRSARSRSASQPPARRERDERKVPAADTGHAHLQKRENAQVKMKKQAEPHANGSSSDIATRERDARKAAAEDKSYAHLQQREEARTNKDAEHRADGYTSPRDEPKRQLVKENMGPSRSKGADNKDESKNDGSGAKYIEVGGGGAVPGIDAPVSAVNAGERRVRVQYRESSINLPVTPSTRAKDLLFSAANCLTGGIDPKKSIIMESFTQLGLERPLRRYEHVRDVMNSWASDGENSLVIVPAASEDELKQLELKNVPSNPPRDATFHIHYSQRPGKWDKRYVTLRSDGQITMSKKEYSQEQTNICHLSDFDIYSPTGRYLSKMLKPPKRFSYAVKSQQKSSMFLSTENFVHFFTTNDKEVAEAWHKAVQTWRGWYLVNKLGAGQKKTTEDSPVAASAGHLSPRHRRGVSSELYQLGSFKPLLDLNPFEDGNEETIESVLHSTSPTDQYNNKSSDARGMYTQKKSTRERGPPPSSFPKDLSLDTDAATLYAGASGSGTDEDVDTAFSPSGLLGRKYSQRYRAMREREEREKRANQDPFSPQGLINAKTWAPSPSHHQPSNPPSHANSRSNTMRSTQAPDPNGLSRSISLHQKQKPLVDLTPAYQEPPQHVRKGRGVKVEPGVALVDVATGPDLPTGAIPIPPSTTWRRPPPGGHQQEAALAGPGPGTDSRTRKRSNTARSVHHHHHHRHHRQYHGTVTAPTSPATGATSPQATPFAPNSLLARSNLNFAERGIPRGHGVATGDRNATKPMLDMSDMNPFAEGSLLSDLKV